MRLRVRLLSASLICAVTLVASGVDASDAGPQYIPGFPGELAPDGMPDGTSYLNLDQVTVRVLRGMNEGILLGLSLGEDASDIVLRVKEVVDPVTEKTYVPDATASPDAPVGCELVVVSRSKR